MDGASQRAQDAYERARRHGELGRFADALDGFRSVLESIGVPTAAAPRPLQVLWARATLGVALCLYETIGDLATALGHLDDAEAWCVRHGLGDEELAVLGQRGLLLLRSGDIPAALAALDRAAPELSRAASRDSAVLLLNRGALHLESGTVDKARTDLAASVEHAMAIGDVSIEAKGRHNLGYAEYLRGDLPAALRLMDTAYELDPAEDDAVGLLDRAVVLQEAGLVTEAVSVLERAVRILTEQRSSADLARAQLDVARCLLLLQQEARAAATAADARQAFVTQSNRLWALRAEIVELEAELAALPPDAAQEEFRSVAASARGMGARAEDAGAGMVAAPARVLEAEALVRAGEVAAATGVLDSLTVASNALPLPVRIQREAVRALVAFRSGDRRRGLAAIRRGQAVLMSYRSRLGSLDAVTASALHGVRLGNVDVLAAVDTRRAATVLDAVERGRAAFAGSGRVRPPSDAVLAERLAAARREVESARALGTSGEPQQSVQRQDHLRAARRLQEEARRLAWQHQGDAQIPRPTTERALRSALAAAGDDTVVADLLLIGDDVLAVRVTRQGSRFVRLAARAHVAELARRARADFGVLSNALIPEPMRAAAWSSLERSLVGLDEAVVVPLEAEGDLHLAVRDLLLGLPWPALPSRRGRRTWANSWLDLRVGDPARRSDDVLVVAGPGLHASVNEAKLVGEVWGSSTVLTGDDATCGAVVEALDGAGVVHLAAHGTHETDNPLFSSLRLADGPLFAHELDGIDLRGAVVVLSACEVGLSTARIGGEALGLTSVLLRLGARAVIASVAPLRDDVAARVMPAFHAELRDGATPGSALALAIADETEPVPLVCFGPLVL